MIEVERISYGGMPSSSVAAVRASIGCDAWTSQTRANPYTAVCKALADAYIEYANSEPDNPATGPGPTFTLLDAVDAARAAAAGIAAYAAWASSKDYLEKKGSKRLYEISARAADEVVNACPLPTNCKELRDAGAARVEATTAYIASPEAGGDAYQAVHEAQDFYHAAGLNAQAPVVVTTYESTVKAIVEFCSAEHGPDASWCGGSVTNQGPQNHYRAAKAAANSCR